MQMQRKIGLTFASALRAFLRQDPDVILVGEIRDKETAGIAVEAALTGHMLFSTLHTNDATGAISRLIDMGVEPFLISSALVGVMSQRLVRRVCSSCGGEGSAENLNWQAGADATTRCRTCGGTGYRGRTAIAELLDMSDRIRQMILEKKPGSDIKRAAKEEGMTFLRETALAKVFSGQSTLHEVNKVTFVD